MSDPVETPPQSHPETPAQVPRPEALQLTALREDLRRAVAQHTEALREEVRRAVAQQADVLATTRAASARRRDVPLWLLTVLLILTCARVLLLVVHQVLGW